MRNTSLPIGLLGAALASVSLTSCDSPEAFFGGSILAMSIVGIAAIILIIIAVIDLIKRPMDLTTKIIWGLVIWFLPLIGAIVYLVMGRK